MPSHQFTRRYIKKGYSTTAMGSSVQGPPRATRESGESNEVIGKQFSRKASLDIHGVESGHVVDLIAGRRIKAIPGEASCIDVVHFNVESEVFDCEDGDLLVEQSPFYVLPDFQSRNLYNSPLNQVS